MTESHNLDEPDATSGFLIVDGVKVREIDETNLMRWRWADTDGHHEIVWVRHPSVVFHSVQAPHQDTWHIHTLAGDPGDGERTPAPSPTPAPWRADSCSAAAWDSTRRPHRSDSVYVPRPRAGPPVTGR